MSHRLRTTVVLLVTLFVGFAWLAVAMMPAHAVTTHTLTIHFGTWRYGDSRVELTVPSSWHVSQTAPTGQCGCGGDYDPVCIVASGDYGLNPNNCELVVGGNISEQLPDEPVPGWRLPKCDDWTTTYEAHSQVGLRPAEYRIFLDRCHDRKSEQWTSLTTPSISIWHPLHWSYDDTLAANAVHTAGIAGRGMKQGRTNQAGYVRNMFEHDGRVYLTLDRAVASLNGHMMNRYPTTYTYRLRPRKYYGGCPQFFVNCTPEQLLTIFHKGLHPADGSRPFAGRLIGLGRSTRGWGVGEARRWKFESRGDPGHCGC